MTFAVPLFLLATLAAAVPVVLHLMNRQQAKNLPFSTLRFLLISVQKTRRRKRINDLLLMLLRMAVLILLALGLAKPTITSLGSLFGGGATSAVAIVLDNSASMGVKDAGQMRFETARAAAMQIMDELRDGDQVALFLTGGVAFPEQARLDRTHEKVRQMLAACQVSYERADLGVKIEQARAVLAESKAVNKQIFVLTDSQKHAWAGLSKEDNKGVDKGAQAQTASDSNAKTAEEQETLAIPIILVDCHREPEPNVAIDGVELSAQMPVAGMPVQASVDLFNASPVDQKRHIELLVNGNKVQSSPALDIPAESHLKHDFLFTFDRGGLQRGEVRLVGVDGSKLDDRRFFTMEINQGIPVAVVKAQKHEIPYLEDTFYLSRALAPARGDGWAIQTTELTADELPSEPLSRYRVVYCVNLPAPGAEAAERLRRYVTDGGNLVWICGDNIDPEAYNQMNEAAGGQLLPAPLLDVREPEPGSERDSWHIGFLDKEHAALRDLHEPSSLYQSVLVYKNARIDAAASPDAWTLARLDDGKPLLTQRSVEKGKVLFLGTSAHVGWTNLPVRPLFLPLLARLTFDLAAVEQSHHEVLAGAPLALSFDDRTSPVGVEVQPPGGATIRLNTENEEGHTGQIFRYGDTHDIGIYLLRLTPGGSQSRIAFSVNVDPDEALPEKIGPEELQELLGQTPLIVAENPDDLSSTFKLLREGKSLWSLFLSAVLVVLVFESFVANRLSPKKEDGAPAGRLPPGLGAGKK